MARGERAATARDGPYLKPSFLFPMSAAVQTFPSGVAGAILDWPKPAKTMPPAERAFPSGAKPATKPKTMADDASRKQDDELIARTQAGDTNAFDELFVKY